MQALQIPVWLWSICQIDEPIPPCYRCVSTTEAKISAGLAALCVELLRNLCIGVMLVILQEMHSMPNLHSFTRSRSACIAAAAKFVSQQMMKLCR